MFAVGRSLADVYIISVIFSGIENFGSIVPAIGSDSAVLWHQMDVTFRDFPDAKLPFGFHFFQVNQVLGILDRILHLCRSPEET